MPDLLSRALVGRDEVRTHLLEALDAAEDGQGTVVALAGGAGIGKSALRRSVERVARDRGVLVLSGRAVAGRSEPLRPFAEALAGLARLGDDGPLGDAALLPLRPVLGHLVPDWPPGSAAPSALAVAEALLRLLEVTRRRSPILLTLDDVQWADDDAVAVLEYLADHAQAHGALLLVTLRPQPVSPAWSAVRRLADRRVAALVQLQPLGDEDVARMVRSCLDQDAVAGELLAFVRSRADGVPFFVEELLAGLARSGALVQHPDGWHVVGHRLRSAVPATLADSVARRFSSLHANTRRTLAAAALLGRRFDWELLPAITGLPRDVVGACLREATYAQLLDGGGGQLRFRHALTRDHVLELLGPPHLLPQERAEIAARAAEVVRDRHPGLPGEWCDVTAALEELAGRPHAAARCLLTGAERARARGAVSTATALLRRARELADRGPAEDPDLRLAVDERLAAVLALAGDVDAAQSLAADALDRLPPGEVGGVRRVDLLLALARAALTAGRLDEAAHHAERAVREARDLDDREHTARAVVLQAHLAMARGDVRDAEDTARRALALAGPTGRAAPQPEVRCEALEILGRAARLHDLAAAERCFDEAASVAQQAGLAVWRARALHELGTIDLLDTLRLDRLRLAHRAAVETGAIATAAVVDLHLAWALVARSDGTAGRQVAERAVAVASRLGLPILPYAHVVVARSFAHAGDAEQVEAALQRARQVAPGDPEVEAAALSHGTAMLALHLADVDAARAALDEAAQLLRRCPGAHNPFWGLWALLRTFADQQSGAVRREAAGAAGSDTRYNRALLQAADAVAEGRAGESDTATERMQQALKLLSASEGWDLLRHVPAWIAASAALADGWGSPVTWLEDGLRWFASCGQDALATSCRVLLREAGAAVPRRTSGWQEVPEPLRAQGVTARELEVLVLLARGRTYREAAAALVLSPKTAEKHVGNLLRKTGQPNRDGLSQLAASLGLR